jgi:hypothetical protein
MMESGHWLSHVEAVEKHGGCGDSYLMEFEFVTDCFDELAAFAAIYFLGGRGEAFFDTRTRQNLGFCEKPL